MEARVSRVSDLTHVCTDLKISKESNILIQVIVDVIRSGRNRSIFRYSIINRKSNINLFDIYRKENGRRFSFIRFSVLR